MFALGSGCVILFAGPHSPYLLSLCGSLFPSLKASQHRASTVARRSNALPVSWQTDCAICRISVKRPTVASLSSMTCTKSICATACRHHVDSGVANHASRQGDSTTGPFDAFQKSRMHRTCRRLTYKPQSQPSFNTTAQGQHKPK